MPERGKTLASEGASCSKQRFGLYQWLRELLENRGETLGFARLPRPFQAVVQLFDRAAQLVHALGIGRNFSGFEVGQNFQAQVRDAPDARAPR